MERVITAAKVGDLLGLQRALEEGGPGVDINGCIGNDGITPLHWAALGGHVEVVRYLLRRKAHADVQTQDEGCTPMMWASIEGHLRVVHILAVEGGASLHATDNRGYNALHHAIQYGRITVAHYLLHHGLDVDSRDAEAHTPLMWACYRNHDLAVRYLLAQGAHINAVHYFELVISQHFRSTTKDLLRCIGVL